MGANCFFDEMLPTISTEANGIDDPERQVEVFTYGGGLFLRIGPPSGDLVINRYTVELTSQVARKLVSGIEDGIFYLNRIEQ